MKTWLFAILQAAIAVAGLTAFFWAENVLLTGAAAVMAATLGIAQPLLAARAARRMERYQDAMFNSSVDAVDEQIAQLEQELVAVPEPNRQITQAVLCKEFSADADELGAQYGRVIKAIDAKSFAAEELAAAFVDKLGNHPLAIHLYGMAALSQGNVADAQTRFAQVTKQRPAWISPWVGWATAAWQLNQFDEICEHHPQVSSVALTPYDVGDEQTFIELDEYDRDALVEQFQASAKTLGNFYTMAEFSKSKVQIEQSRQQLRSAA